MLELLQIPLVLFAFLLNTLFGIIQFSVNLVLTLISALGPFLSLGLFFVSNDGESKAVLMAMKSPPAISTPADGEWFSKFLESDSEITTVQFQKDKIIIAMPQVNEPSHFVPLNIYSVQAKPKTLAMRINEIRNDKK